MSLQNPSCPHGASPRDFCSQCASDRAQAIASKLALRPLEGSNPRTYLPSKAVRPSVADITSDIYAVIRREVAKYTGPDVSMGVQDIRALSELARTLREVRALEALVEEELGDRLAKETDSELRERMKS